MTDLPMATWRRKLGWAQLDSSRWAWTRTPLAIAIISRVFSFSLIAALELLWPFPYVPLASPANRFTAWDGQWYLSIAANGYHAAPLQLPNYVDYAFFPLWPGLLALFPVEYRWLAGLTLTTVFFAIAAVLMWRLLADVFDPTVATGGTALLAFAPPSFAFSMLYTEPLFLMLAAAALLALRRSRRSGPVFALLAGLTRASSLGIAAAAIVAAVRARGSARWTATATVLAIVSALALWAVFNAVLTGDPLSFAVAGSNWTANTAGPAAIARFFSPSIDTIRSLAVVLVVLAASVRLATIDLELGAYSLTCLWLAIWLGAMSSIPRYTLAAFPAFGVLASWAGPRGTVVLLVFFAILQVAFALMSLGPNPVLGM